MKGYDAPASLAVVVLIQLQEVLAYGLGCRGRAVLGVSVLLACGLEVIACVHLLEQGL